MKSIESNQEYYNQKFSNLELLNQSFFEVVFENCIFTNCNLQQSSFSKCIFDNCNFDNCNLSIVDFDKTQLLDCEFKDSKLVGIKWFKINTSLGFRCKYIESDISSGEFSEMNLTKCIIKNCNCKNIFFGGANLTRLDFGTTDFTSSVFGGTNLTKSDFSKSTNYLINYETNTLKGAKFAMPEAIGLLKPLDIEII